MFLKIKKPVNKNFKTRFLSLKINMKKLDQLPVIQLIVCSLVLNFVIEMLSRRSIPKGIGFLFSNPLMFIFNVAIILFTLSISLMFSRKNFLLVLISTLWLVLGIGDYILLGYRTTPLTATDFYIFKSVSEILHMYVNTFQIILAIVVAVIVVLALIFVGRKLPKSKAQFKAPLMLLCVTALLMFMLSSISLKVNALSTNFGNLAEAFSDYGFAYCFSTSIFDRGINEPDAYSEENIDAVLETIESADPSDDLNPTEPSGAVTPDDDMVEPLPNVIFVQLESFFDVNHLINFTFSENPTPNFTQLSKEYSSGFLTVPSIGAGTANTEFEVLTGMDLEYFGAGEYPYKTILQTSTCESIPFNLKALGYHSHAIHNNTGTFYDRNKVFQKLGFDSYSSIEYMNDVEYNPLGWAKDHVLTTEIMKELDASYVPDFVYTITVQAHGKYPDEVVDDTQTITVNVDPNKRQTYEEEDDGDLNTTESILGATGTEQTTTEVTNSDENTLEPIELDKSYKNGFEYYVSQLNQTDQFIGELVSKLSVYKEKTIVIFYGDHLPSMSFEDGDLVNNNKFQTGYVLWSNYKMDQVNRDLKAYQLSAYVMERLGYDSGVLTKFHQRYVGEPDYQKELEMLQYDMLYGDKNAFGGVNPYIEAPIQMGVFEIEVTDVIEKGEVTFIKGKNFTPWSVVYIDDKPKETLYIDKNTLIVPYQKFTDQRIYVAQVNNNDMILSQSKDWVLSISED